MLKSLSFLFFAALALIFQHGISGAPTMDPSSQPDINRQRGVTVTGPSIQLSSPTTENFFSSGRKIFPPTAQAPADSPGIAAGRGAASEIPPEYIVGPGDRFLINFWGRIEDALVVRVNSNGSLFIPRVGVIEASGHSYQEVQSLIVSKLNSALKNVQFTVSLLEPRHFQIYVLGSVNVPGPYSVQGIFRASDVIAMAQGVNRTGSNQFIELRRGDKVIHVDLIRFYSSADFTHNPLVTDGDVIFVPDLKDFATVSGAVVRPGTFELRVTKDLEEVIRQMGGYSIYADLKAPIKLSRIESTGERRQFLVEREAGKSRAGVLPLKGLQLQHGDEVFVPSGQLLIPSKSDLVFVTGEVKNPGAKPYVPSSSIDEYLGVAGGLSNRANISQAVVYKADGSVVKIKPRMSVEPGDTIYVPEKSFKFWQDHLVIITTFLSLATTVIAINR